MVLGVVGAGKVGHDAGKVESAVVEDAVDDGFGLCGCHAAAAHAGVDFDVEVEF